MAKFENEFDFAGGPIFAVARNESVQFKRTDGVPCVFVFRFMPKAVASFKSECFNPKPEVVTVGITRSECEELGVDPDKLMRILEMKFYQVAVTLNSMCEENTGTSWEVF